MNNLRSVAKISASSQNYRQNFFVQQFFVYIFIYVIVLVQNVCIKLHECLGFPLSTAKKGEETRLTCFEEEAT